MTKITWFLGSIMALLVVAWRRFGDRWGWLGMLNAWVEWVMVALGSFALVAGLQRRWGQCGFFLGVLALGMERFVGNPFLFAFRGWGHQAGMNAGMVRSSDNALVFKLFGANMYKRNPTAKEHIELILREQPDVICLQEFGPIFADEMWEALQDKYPYRVWRPEPGAYGFGVLSRYPVQETGYWDKPGVRAWGQRVQVRLPDDVPVEIYSVHLVPPTSDSTYENGMTWGFRTREAQIRLMQREIEARGMPACVIGDCNFNDTSDAYLIACETWQDSWQVAGKGSRWTWPTKAFPFNWQPWNPRMLRLDYCFHNDYLHTQEMKVLRSYTGSDHTPLLTTLEVKS